MFVYALYIIFYCKFSHNSYYVIWRLHFHNMVLIRSKRCLPLPSLPSDCSHIAYLPPSHPLFSYVFAHLDLLLCTLALDSLVTNCTLALDLLLTSPHLLIGHFYILHWIWESEPKSGLKSGYQEEVLHGNPSIRLVYCGPEK